MSKLECFGTKVTLKSVSVCWGSIFNALAILFGAAWRLLCFLDGFWILPEFDVVDGVPGVAEAEDASAESAGT
jgi:hypothetical protein